MLRLTSRPAFCFLSCTISPNQLSSQRGSFSRGRLVATTLLVLALSCLVSLPAFGQCDTTWIGVASGGLWNQAAGWSAGVPTSTTNVCIDNGNGQASAVVLNISGAQAANLTIDANDSLNFNNATTLTINGTDINNAGQINLNSTGSFAQLIIGSPAVTLSGGGTVTMSNNTTNSIFGSVTADTLINQETIQGAGNIGLNRMTLINSGTINSTQSAGLIIQANGGTTNTGTIKATGGMLTLSNMVVNNTGGTISSNAQTLAVTNSTVVGGTITLTGAALLQMSNSEIQSGILNNSATGTIEALSFTTNTLWGTVNNPAGGLIKIDNGAVLKLGSGSYPTLGTVTLNSTGNSTQLIMQSGNVILSGGTVTLSNNVNNLIFGNAADDTLTNQETIQGAGNIGSNRLTLVNSGTIDANQSAGLTIQANGGTTNTGTIKATAGALTLTGMTVNNTGGTILSNAQTLHVTNTTINGGTVNLVGAALLQLSSSTIQGATINNSATGIIEAVSFTTNTLGGTISNPAGGVIQIDNGAVINLENGNYPNLGKITLNSTGNNTELVVLDGNVTLSGGSVTMSNNAANLIFGGSTTDTLTNQETIQGSGNIGSNRLTLVNSGTILANQSAGLTIQANGGTINTGTIRASLGTLTFSGTTVTNTGGTITTNGQNLKVTNSTINGGTVNVVGAGLVQLSNSTIQNGTLNNSATGTIEALSFTNNTLGGTISNPAGGLIKIDNGAVINLAAGNYPNLGTVTLNSTGNNTELVVVGGNVTLSGGTVTLSNSTTNLIFGGTTTDTLTNQETIQGAGNIGSNRMTLVNSGTINANQSAGLTIQPNGGTINTGTIKATSGTLTISNTTVSNGGGTITSNGQTLVVTNSTINGGTVSLTGAGLLQLSNSIIQSGTLNNSTTGTIEALSFTNNTLGGTLNNPAGGLIKIDNGAVINLQNGSYANGGSITLNSTGNNTELVVAGASVTLTGVGNVTMSNSANNFILGAVNTYILTNKVTIQGSGNIGNNGMGLVNGGTIIANQSTPLIIQPNFMGFTNNGTLQVNSGDMMLVKTGPFSNFVGTTLTGGTYNVAGTLEIDQLGNAGGEIVTNAAKIILNGPSSSFVDAAMNDALTNLKTNATGSGFTIIGGRNFTTAGNFTNNGTLTVGSGSTFKVNGNLTNLSSGTLNGGVYSISGTFQFNGANIVNNSANITLNGAASKIIAANGSNGLANFAKNTALGTFALTGGRNFTTKANFTNNGVLTIGSGSKFNVHGSLTNFAATKLTGGTYNVTGTLQFNNANIVTNAANITLTGAGSKIVNQTGVTDGLANFATNAAAGIFTIASGRNFTTAGAFSNAGTLKVSTGTTFTMAAGTSYTQTAGKTTNDGTMTATGAGVFAMNTGAIFGNNGSFSGNLTSGGTFNVGDAVNLAGKMAVTGTYAQSAAGTLKTDIGGLNAGTQFDQLNVTGAVTLGGTLSLQLINGFVPTLGSSFDILNFASSTGNFATITGMHINANEHFAVVVNPTNVTLNVVAGPSPLDLGTGTGGASPTPEPSTLLLLGSGLAGLAAYGRRLKRG